MKDYFERANKFVGIAEGGRNFSIVDGKPVIKGNAKADQGGATAFGITWGTLKAAHKDGLVSHDDITKLTKEEADAIYKKKYWEASHADEMEWPLCLCHYDWAVNAGIGQATKTLQKACNKMGSTLTVDGGYGSLTAKEVSKYDPQELSRRQLALRLSAYSDMVANRPSNAAFLKGWAARVKRLEKEVG